MWSGVRGGGGRVKRGRWRGRGVRRGLGMCSGVEGRKRGRGWFGWRLLIGRNMGFLKRGRGGKWWEKKDRGFGEGDKRGKKEAEEMKKKKKKKLKERERKQKRTRRRILTLLHPMTLSGYHHHHISPACLPACLHASFSAYFLSFSFSFSIIVSI